MSDMLQFEHTVATPDGERRAIVEIRWSDGRAMTQEEVEPILVSLAVTTSRVFSKDRPIHVCPHCVCGQIELFWSDRATHAFPDDYRNLARAITCCALDHSYDRTGDGIPYGFTDEQRKVCAPIVDRHLSAVEPNWRKRTVYQMDDGAREAMRAELEAALRSATKCPDCDDECLPWVTQGARCLGRKP